MQIFSGQDALYSAETVKSRVWSAARAPAIAVLATFFFAPQQTYAEPHPAVQQAVVSGHTPGFTRTISATTQSYTDVTPVVFRAQQSALVTGGVFVSTSASEQRYSNAQPVVTASLVKGATPRIIGGFSVPQQSYSDRQPTTFAADSTPQALAAYFFTVQQQYVDSPSAAFPITPIGPTGSLVTWAGASPQDYVAPPPFVSRPQAAPPAPPVGSQVFIREQRYDNASPILSGASQAGHTPGAAPFFAAAPIPRDLAQQAVFMPVLVGAVTRVIVVPDVVGWFYGLAHVKLMDMGFALAAPMISSPTGIYSPGVVVHQYPAAGSQVVSGTTLTLTVNGGSFWPT